MKGPIYHIAVETIRNDGELSTAARRVKPLPGQGAAESLRVECSKDMRDEYPLGSVFIIIARMCDRQGTDFIFSSFKWPYKKISRVQAVKLIKEGKLGFVESARAD